MLFRALIVSLGCLWLDLKISFAGNSLKLSSSYFSSPVLAIIVKNEKKNAFSNTNFYIKISKNLGGNFSNLGSNCLDIWQFFRNFLAFQKASFQHFTNTIARASSCQQWFLQTGRCATKEEKPLRATVCFSIEHARPRDITFSCFARNISKTTTLHVLLNFLLISFRFYIVCYTAVFSVVTQRSSPQTAAENRTTFLSLCVCGLTNKPIMHKKFDNT